MQYGIMHNVWIPHCVALASNTAAHKIHLILQKLGRFLLLLQNCARHLKYAPTAAGLEF